MPKMERLEELRDTVYEMVVANPKAYLGTRPKKGAIRKGAKETGEPTIEIDLGDDQFATVRMENMVHVLLQHEIHEWTSENIEPVVDQYFSMFKAALYGVERLSREEVLEHLAIRLQDPKYLDEVPEGIAKKAWGDLLICPVLDLPHSIHSITVDQLQKWELTIDNVVEKALDNLRERFEHLTPRKLGAPLEDLPYWTFQARSEDFCLESSFVLLPEMVAKIPIGQVHMCVMITNHNHIVFARKPQSTKEYQGLIDHLERFYNDINHPISPCLYTWTLGMLWRLEWLETDEQTVPVTVIPIERAPAVEIVAPKTQSGSPVQVARAPKVPTSRPESRWWKLGADLFVTGLTLSGLAFGIALGIGLVNTARWPRR